MILVSMGDFFLATSLNKLFSFITLNETLLSVTKQFNVVSHHLFVRNGMDSGTGEFGAAH